MMENNLAAYMRSANITQNDLAKKTGISRQSINRICNNKVVPSALAMKRIKDALNDDDEKLNATIDDIFFSESVILVLREGVK